MGGSRAWEATVEKLLTSENKLEAGDPGLGAGEVSPAADGGAAPEGRWQSWAGRG